MLFKIFSFIFDSYFSTLLKQDVPKDGMLAALNEFSLTDNPFPKNTPDHSIWRVDFMDAAGRLR